MIFHGGNIRKLSNEHPRLDFNIVFSMPVVKLWLPLGWLNKAVVTLSLGMQAIRTVKVEEEFSLDSGIHVHLDRLIIMVIIFLCLRWGGRLARC